MLVELNTYVPLLFKNGFKVGEQYKVVHQSKVIVDKREGRWKRCYLIERRNKISKGELKYITIYQHEFKKIVD